MYKSMGASVKAEQDEVIKLQRYSMHKTGVYNILDKRVEKTIQDYYEIKQKRLSNYPVDIKN
jgi:hypothetical protein